ncbi:uncharacterized protein LOC106133939 [Amyelois transitella]|uniref:uncharacterized protein LOC106133939 n=1 Tax=Amyelois transitella TaxID=680683 RepID=UPI00067E1F6B|nr:uncharacterized protein LOC106133939 [Amyelois transitella]XP_013189280.1 uncharacterized protein LOC106133939 [Amyelois transitella]XP_013189281.1 uncharacterized protein LOC106133939 [Amyelois transitella]
MRLSAWWQILLALLVRCSAQTIVPSLCEEEFCRCDSFTRLHCNCTDTNPDVVLRADGAYRVPSTATAIIIYGCQRVQFLPETVRNLIQLRNIEISDSQNVVIDDRAMAWSPFSRHDEMTPGIRIVIQNSTISEISAYAIQGRVNDIILNRNRIFHMEPFAFSSLIGVKNIQLTDNIFENIDMQAFKQFTTQTFQLRGGVIGTLPSRFLSDVEVTDLFWMEGVRVNSINSMTFLINSPKRVIVEGNRIGTLQGDGFLISTRGPVTFRNNTVTIVRNGAFHGFSVQRETVSVLGRQELLLDNNTVTELMPSALTYNNTLSLRIDGLKLNRTCSCELTEDWHSMLVEHGGTISCWYSLEDHFVSLPTFINNRCGEFKQTFWIYVVITFVVVIVIAIAITIWWIRSQNRKKKSKVQIVMPDGKTYRETEIYIMERAELLTTDL